MSPPGGSPSPEQTATAAAGFEFRGAQVRLQTRFDAVSGITSGGGGAGGETGSPVASGGSGSQTPGFTKSPQAGFTPESGARIGYMRAGTALGSAGFSVNHALSQPTLPNTPPPPGGSPGRPPASGGSRAQHGAASADGGDGDGEEELFHPASVIIRTVEASGASHPDGSPLAAPRRTTSSETRPGAAEADAFPKLDSPDAPVRFLCCLP